MAQFPAITIDTVLLLSLLLLLLLLLLLSLMLLLLLLSINWLHKSNKDEYLVV